MFVCSLGTERDLATAYDLNYTDRISIRQGLCVFFQFFHVKEVKFNLQQAMKAHRRNYTLPLISALNVGG